MAGRRRAGGAVRLVDRLVLFADVECGAGVWVVGVAGRVLDGLVTSPGFLAVCRHGRRIGPRYPFCELLCRSWTNVLFGSWRGKVRLASWLLVSIKVLQIGSMLDNRAYVN